MNNKSTPEKRIKLSVFSFDESSDFFGFFSDFFVKNEAIAAFLIAILSDCVASFSFSLTKGFKFGAFNAIGQCV